MKDAHRIRHGVGLATIVVVALFAAGGCDRGDGGNGGNGLTPPPGEEARSEKARVTSPDVPQADLTELVTGNSAFAFDLYQQIRDREGNLFYSPHSISLALAMTYAGARNETEQQMADALRFTLPQDRLHPAFNALDLALDERGQAAPDADGEGFELHVVNRIWGLIGFSFVPDYLDTLAENYGAGLSLLDFLNAPEPSRVVINDWVADQTQDRIEDLIPQGGVGPATRLVLTNAIYFKAAWRSPFKEALTSDETFNLLDGDQIEVPMMHQTDPFGYAAGDGYQALELLYEGGDLSMVILLPDAGRFEAFEGQLDAARVQDVLEDLNVRDISLALPRFTFEWGKGLRETLSALGMPIAFSGMADFSGISPGGALAIDEVIHKAFVKVDEEGTEAAAATAVIMVGTSAPVTPLPVTVDRPFVFLIRDIETGAILFVGRVLNPSG